MSARKKERGPGRPEKPSEERLQASVNVRLTTEERAEVDRAVEASGDTLSRWARKALISAARAR